MVNLCFQYKVLDPTSRPIHLWKALEKADLRTHDSISDENGNFGWNFQSIVKGRVPVSGYSSCPASIKFRSKFKFSHYW